MNIVNNYDFFKQFQCLLLKKNVCLDKKVIVTTFLKQLITCIESLSLSNHIYLLQIIDIEFGIQFYFLIDKRNRKNHKVMFILTFQEILQRMLARKFMNNQSIIKSLQKNGLNHSVQHLTMEGKLLILLLVASVSFAFIFFIL